MDHEGRSNDSPLAAFTPPRSRPERPEPPHAARDLVVPVGGSPVLPWEPLDEITVADCRVFSVKKVQRRSPRTGRSHDFFVLHGEDWVNVIPLAPDGRVILVRQYRHGTRDITLEIPGGVIEHGEAPGAAAARELLEETGFSAGRWTELGFVHPNPAIQGNRCYTFLAEDLEYQGPQHLDGTEEIEVVSVLASDLEQLVASGIIRHSLVVAAFYWLELHRRRQDPPKND